MQEPLPPPYPYPIDFAADGQRIASGLLGPFDAKGIPLVNYDERYEAAGIARREGMPFGVHYTPVTVCIFGFSLLQKIAAGGDHAPQARERLLSLAEWLVDSILPLGDDAGIWAHHFQVPFAAGVAPPYASGIAQAHAVSLLLRVHRLEPQDRFLGTAHKAFASFFVDVSDGGVSCVQDGFRWIEEWPSNPRSHVLNGFMFALIAIHDYLGTFGTDRARTLWDETLRTLEHHIERFDCGFGSRYDLLRGLVVSETYHRLHVQLLRVVGKMAHSRKLLGVADRWEGYLSSHGGLARKMMAFRSNVLENSEYRSCKIRQIGRRLGLRN